MRVPRITQFNRRWWVLGTMAGSLSMIMIDQTVVSVALPTMHRDLQLSSAGAQWVVNVYMLLLAMLVVVGSKLGDMFGPRAAVPAWGGRVRRRSKEPLLASRQELAGLSV